MKSKSTVRNLLGAAIILIILGLGNLTLGSVKTNQYYSILSRAKRELASPQHLRQVPLSDPSIAIDQKIQNIERLQARVDFYQFTTLGGKVFLVLAGICLLILLLVHEPTEASDSTESTKP